MLGLEVGNGVLSFLSDLAVLIFGTVVGTSSGVGDRIDLRSMTGRNLPLYCQQAHHLLNKHARIAPITTRTRAPMRYVG